MLDPYLITLIGLGLLVLLVAWLPMAVRDLPLSLPIICVGIGFLLFSLPSLQPAPQPLDNKVLAEHVSELVLIVALMGAGLSIDRRFGWRSWQVVWRLLGVTMPLSILAIAVSAWWLVSLDAATALLIGAALAPTDPVLAADVKVGPPGGGDEDDVRFSLTAEAGLNDGLAFPFVALAIGLTAAGGLTLEAALGWLAYDVLWRIAVGVAIGWLTGRGLGWIAFHLPEAARLSGTGDGVVALGMTFVAYATAELAGGYGFLAVFVTGLAFRGAEHGHDFHDDLHGFADQIERLLLMVLLVLFGGAVAGGLLSPLTVNDMALALVTLFVIRPLSGMIGLAGCTQPVADRALISFFGIRGVGSFYYTAYALNHGAFADGERLWAIVGLIVLVSIAVHGVTVTPLMRRLDRRLAG